MRPPRSDDSHSSSVFRRLFSGPTSADVRVQRCLEAFAQALEEHDCQLVVSVAFVNGGATPTITIVPNSVVPASPDAAPPA